jgi:tetratricopeptide (TPR) repeat protein
MNSTDMPDYQQKIENFISSLRDQDLPLGDMIINRQRLLPAYDFYSKKPERQSTTLYIRSFMPKILEFNSKNRQLQALVDDMILKAQEFSWNGNTEKAIITYEALIRDKYPYHKPYNLLINLYQKNKKINNEMQALDRAINFFTKLREDQKEYVLTLANRFNCQQKAQQYIDSRKKIMYYADAFVLYDPAIILDQWKKRLDQINKMIMTGDQQARGLMF